MHHADRKFSVVIPLYNKQESVARAMQSVLEQKVEEFELIVVDDGSTDASLSRVKDIRDERIILVGQENRGASAARNKGITLAKYPYVTFLDADDIWLPDYLQLITRLIERYPSAGAYATNYLIHNAGGDSRPAAMKHVPEEEDGGLIDSYFRSTAHGNTPITSSTVCIPRRVFDKVGMFPEGVRLYEDLDMWTRISVQFPIAYNNLPGAIYQRDAENRACNRIVPDRSDLQFAKSLTTGIESGEISGREVGYANEFINRYALLNAFKSVIAGETSEARYILSGVRVQSLDNVVRKVFIYTLSIFPKYVVDMVWKFGKGMKG